MIKSANFKICGAEHERPTSVCELSVAYNNFIPPHSYKLLCTVTFFRIALAINFITVMIRVLRTTTQSINCHRSLMHLYITVDKQMKE